MAYISKYSGEEIENAVNTINNFDISQLRDFFYPIGSIYTSTQSISPATLFGGTWVQIKDTFLLTAGDTYSAGATGGAATHTHTSAAHTHTTSGHALTVNEMPSHTHHYQINIQHSDGATTTGESLKSGLQVNGRRRYTDYTNASGGGASHSHGDTGSTTPEATGSSSSLPPYRVVYAWERIS